jgi:MFS transporter, PPP family, 3-phenylpropionic acid transporter
MKKPNLTVQFSMAQSFYWWACCIISSFLIPYYQGLGYDAFMIGVLSMVMSLSCTVAQPLWGIYCDRSGRIKQALVVSILLSLPFAWLLFATGKNTLLLAASIAMLSVTFMSMPSILDAWILKLGNQGDSVNYSLTRGVGSLFFAVAAVGFGAILDHTGMWVISPAFILSALALLVVILCLKAPRAEAHHGAGNGSAWQCVSTLLRNRKFMVLLLSVTILFMGSGAIDMTFYPVLLRQLGGGNTELGIAYFLMAFSEVPVLFLYSRLATRFRQRTLLCLALFFYMLKCLLIAAAPSVTLLVLAQGMQMLAFGLLLPAAVNYINTITDSSSLVTAQVLYSSATFGVGSIIGSLAGGAIAEALGVRPMMFILFSLVVLAFALFTILTARDGREAE